MKTKLILALALIVPTIAPAQTTTKRLNLLDQAVSQTCSADQFGFYEESDLIKMCVDGTETTLTASGGGDITDVWGCSGGDCEDLVAGSSDSIDAGGAESTNPCKEGTSAPGTCAVGECFFDTDATAGSNLLGCTATDTWTLLGGAGGTPDIDSVTGQSSWDTAATKKTADLTVDGVEVDFESGAAEGYPRLAQSTTPPATDCDAAGEAGRLYQDTDADTDGSVFMCRGAAGWKDIDDDGSAGGIGGTTGATDNRVIRADGTGGSTVQSSPVEISDSGNVRLPNDVYLRWRNAANSADVDLIKINANDQPQMAAAPLITALNTNNKEGINIGQMAGDPSNAGNGGIWINTSTGTLRYRIGSSNVSVATTADLSAKANLSGATFSGDIQVTPPSAQTIAAGNTITDNACGSIKRITSASAVTTSTTDTFTAPASGNAGCVMHVCNENASDAITLDDNANFHAPGNADVVLGADACITVGSSGAGGFWRALSAMVQN